MKKICLLCLFFYAMETIAQNQISIIPQPQSIENRSGSFIINAKTKIYIKNAEAGKSASFLNSYVQKMYGLSLQTVADKSALKLHAPEQMIVLSINKSLSTGKEAYSLDITPKAIKIEGVDEAGVFYGIQSLIQLIPIEKNNTNSFSIPCVKIFDAPRFTYRGMHLDVSRHFFPISFIKKYIDFIAMHKMNRFHWHLTDDQGWRIEIKKYPKLTTVGAYRNGTTIGRYPGTGNTGTRYGGFYTQKEIKDIIQYAGERYVEVIPEIELPGHASAAIAAYPELSCFPEESTKHPEKTAWTGPTTGKQVQQTWGVFEDVFAPTENTFKFLENVFDEVLSLFPSKYIHIGGDECPKESWKRSAFCQRLIKEKNLKDEHGLQSYFITRIEKYINSKGKQIIGWDEILEGGLAPNALVMSWRGEKGGIEAAKQKHQVIMTPGEWMYFDHKQKQKEDSVTIGGYTTVQKVYSYEPLPKQLNAEEAKYVLGAQANVWTEYITNPNKVEYMIFPRMSALSEVLWSSKEQRNWSQFEPRLQYAFKRYSFLGWNYSKAYFEEPIK
ncbi:MAG: beta-N-acetylhexosaminidase [Chitinophagaceae bacterium]|nr:beta-N-acetylhexosaminidase [Chitinophagaceae bacterium]MCA6447615.1 beta-N-acetylhexosaminidase [Chitinophagaceae bacterium]